MNNIWFTSDQHYGHSNIIKYCARPFDSVDEMNETLIENHNKVVQPRDEVYHLGDFCWKRSPELFLDRLNGNHYLIIGNHDHHNKNKNAFAWVKDVYFFKRFGLKIFLSHYAHRAWPNQHHGAIHLYGHSHGMLTDVPGSMDVGVDMGNFSPYHLDEVLEQCNPT